MTTAISPGADLDPAVYYPPASPSDSPDLLDSVETPAFAQAISAADNVPVAISPRPRLRTRQTVWRDAFEFMLLLLSIYALVNLATARAVVEGISMQPNFYTGQLIVVNRLIYYFGQPARGDVIVLHDPEDPSQDFIKRVVGLPGEEIAIRAGRVYVNGTLLNEPYIPTFCQSCDGTWDLDADHYFVLGDNRPNSHDSHAFGPLDRRLIVGKAWLRYWPFNTFGFIPSPIYDPISADRPATPPPTITPIPMTPYQPTPRTGTSIPKRPITAGSLG